jgi:spermidine synthase
LNTAFTNFTTGVGSMNERSATTSLPVVAPVAPAVPGRAPPWQLGLYLLTVFLSAFLLFQVEPLIAKLILPWFGGTAGVWSACMLVFQVLLFCGYAYAHFLIVRLKPRSQAVVHVLVLAAACATLPILPSEARRPTADEDPVTGIVLLLLMSVGLPFFALSATGPLLQGWFGRINAGRSPYRFYALSNVGSLLALITYPSVFEWLLPLRELANLWSGFFGAFAVLCAGCALSAARRGVAPPIAKEAGDDQPTAASDSSERPSGWTKLLWFMLAMVPSVLLLAVTNQVCLDIASVPFLWVLPLTLYLLSFILCFDNDRWYHRRILMPGAAISLAWMYPLLQSAAPIVLQVMAYFTTFFLCAMVCHGELARRRPHLEYLTSFYLLMAAGGAAGGVFVGFIAPLLFNDYYELHLGLLTCAALMPLILFTDHQSPLSSGKRRLLLPAFLLLLGLFAAGLIHDVWARQNNVIARGRNFYGVLTVTSNAQTTNNSPAANYLHSGHILHGVEYTDRKLREIPTTYYGPDSGIGCVLLQSPENKPRRVGAIGLGVGTIAAYARPGDYYRFYEINPLDERFARDHFFYLADCAGRVDIVYGDARLALEREAPENFDVIVLDAFSGDAIPVHLLTVEAFAVYLRHLAPDGIIAVHITNWNIALGPVVNALAHENKLACVAIDSMMVTPSIPRRGSLPSIWVLVARESKILEQPEISKAALLPNDLRIRWTDDHSSLFDVWWARDQHNHAGFDPPSLTHPQKIGAARRRS